MRPEWWFNQQLLPVPASASPVPFSAWEGGFAPEGPSSLSLIIPSQNHVPLYRTLTALECLSEAVLSSLTLSSCVAGSSLSPFPLTYTQVSLVLPVFMGTLLAPSSPYLYATGSGGRGLLSLIWTAWCLWTRCSCQNAMSFNVGSACAPRSSAGLYSSPASTQQRSPQCRNTLQLSGASWGRSSRLLSSAQFQPFCYKWSVQCQFKGCFSTGLYIERRIGAVRYQRISTSHQWLYYKWPNWAWVGENQLVSHTAPYTIYIERDILYLGIKNN